VTLLDSNASATNLRVLGLAQRLLTLPKAIARVVTEEKVTHLLTADTAYSWWWLPRIRDLGIPTTLVPVAILPSIHALGGSVAGLPHVVERMMVSASFKSSDRVLVSRAAPAVGEWVSGYGGLTSVFEAAVTVEEVPPNLPTFTQLRHQVQPVTPSATSPIRLIYVGRIARDKGALDLVEIASALGREGLPFKLTLVGDGPLRKEVEEELEKCIGRGSFEVTGYVPHEEVLRHLQEADIFLSPLTGTALREAGLLGLPVVAYNTDWVKGFMQDGVEASLAPPGDIDSFVKAIINMSNDTECRHRMSVRIRQLFTGTWGEDALVQALYETFPSEEP
jgi:glycosyltransferase involved in cell wall biosynthesis